MKTKLWVFCTIFRPHVKGFKIITNTPLETHAELHNLSKLSIAQISVLVTF